MIFITGRADDDVPGRDQKFKEYVAEKFFSSFQMIAETVK